MTVRRVMYALVFAFTAYFLLRGVIWAVQAPDPTLQGASVAVWLVAVIGAMFLAADPEDAQDAHNRPGRLPLGIGILVLLLGVAAASLSFLGSADRVQELPAAGVYGAVGLLLTIVCVRRRALLAWIGVIALAAQGIAVIGLDLSLQRGLLGAVLWVGLAQLLMWFTDRAYRDTARLARLQQVSSAWQAAQEARRFERRQRVQFALIVAGPVLARVIETGGRLNDTERLRARLAEGTLRDELRGARLLDDEVRLAIRAVRERGATLTIFDENALEDLDEGALQRVRSELAATLRGTSAARIIVRTSPDPDVAVTVVGRSAAGSGIADEDAVELWHEIPRRAPARSRD